MPESLSAEERAILDAIEARCASIDGKLNVLARAIGGPALKTAWDAIEVADGVPARRRTFKRARCGCFRGSPHGEGCAKRDAADPLRAVA